MFKYLILSYQYVYYKFYKFWEFVSVPRFWSDWKAGISLFALELWFFGSIFVYYKIYFNPYVDLKLDTIERFILIIVLGELKYYTFSYNQKWKKIINRFDKLPRYKNILGGWIVFLISIFIFLNLLYSFFLMSKIDWSVYE